MKRLSLLLLAVVLFVGMQAKHISPKTDSVAIQTTVVSENETQSAKDSMLVNKLSADDLMALEREKINLERDRIQAENGNDMPMGSFAIVMICLLPFLFVAVVIFLISRRKNEESKRRYDLYMRSLEMGQTIPEHFFDEPKSKVSTPSSNLKKGILCTVFGLAVLVYFIIIGNSHALIAGIIPLFIGVGFLLVHVLEKPKTNTPDQNDEQHG